MIRSDYRDSPRHVRAWYGLPAEIAVENGLWHLVRAGRITFGHPPLVNLILRRGLPGKDRLELSFFHEFGHLQTLPFALAYSLFLLLFGRWRRPGWGWAFIKKLAAAAIAHEAVWELASETYVIAKTGTKYTWIYQNYPNHLGRAIFWIGMTILSVKMTAEALG